jgi:hypothetical protein
MAASTKQADPDEHAWKGTFRVPQSMDGEHGFRRLFGILP